MRNLKTLLIGELQRLQRYHIMAASLVVTVIWIGVLQFTDVDDVTNIFPLLLFLDATAMSITLIGVSMFFEREEHTLKGLFVAPITKEEYMISKIIGNIVSNLQTLVILYLYAWIFKEINLNIFLLVLYVIIISIFHSMIGFLLAYRSKSFTELLTGVIKYMFIFLIPVVLEQVGVITGDLMTNLLYVLPTKASLLLLNSTTNGVETWEVFYGIFYLIALSLLLAVVIRKGFETFVAKESGI
ncbi:fluoroquinolone export ABC transporter permease subunit [Isachenkonia alkalipeptolytica]|uniref:fluoroquinolone export ABC transporter permease subunit n=1 Tax=Isachenkonia alkalipeptolytica TaxID=2565777 RepID=UPI0013686526